MSASSFVSNRQNCRADGLPRCWTLYTATRVSFQFLFVCCAVYFFQTDVWYKTSFKLDIVTAGLHWLHILWNRREKAIRNIDRPGHYSLCDMKYVLLESKESDFLNGSIGKMYFSTSHNVYVTRWIVWYGGYTPHYKLGPWRECVSQRALFVYQKYICDSDRYTKSTFVT